MCGGGGGGSSRAAREQRRQEDERKRDIAIGKQQLDQIFGGLEGRNRRPANARAAMSYDQFHDQELGNNQIYEMGKTLDRSPSSIFADVVSGAGRGLKDHMDHLTFQEYQKIQNDPRNFTGPPGVPIWQQQQQAYMDYATPQLDDQFGEARKALTFALANQGQLGGSVTGDRWARLNRDHSLQRQQVADTARGHANRARSDIANQKQSLLQMLNATADAGGTATAARDQVAALAQTPSFTPLGPLFQNATAGLAAGMAGRQQRDMAEKTQGIVYGGDPDRGTGRVIR